MNSFNFSVVLYEKYWIQLIYNVNNKMFGLYSPSRTNFRIKKKHFYISSSNRHQFTSKPSMYFDVENLDELVMLP